MSIDFKILASAAAGACVALTVSKIYSSTSSTSSDSSATLCENQQNDNTNNNTERPTLIYWPGRGVVEVSRMMFAIANISFNDVRNSIVPCPSEFGLDSNLGRLPVLKTSNARDEGGSVGQSLSINFYIATVCDLMGTSALEAAQILSVVEHARECKEAWQKLKPYGVEPTQEILDQWFASGGVDIKGTADGKNKGKRYLLWYLGRIERALHNNGFAVGTKLSLADVTLYNIFAETLILEQESVETSPFTGYPTLCQRPMPKWRTEPFANEKRMKHLLLNYPKILSSIEKVRSHTNVQRWLVERGPQNF